MPNEGVTGIQPAIEAMQQLTKPGVLLPSLKHTAADTSYSQCSSCFQQSRLHSAQPCHGPEGRQLVEVKLALPSVCLCCRMACIHVMSLQYKLSLALSLAC